MTAETNTSNPFALAVGAAAALHLLVMSYFLVNGGASSDLVLWSSASIAITAYGGGIVYIIVSLIRGY